MSTITVPSFMATCLEELPESGKDWVDEEAIRGVGGMIYLGECLCQGHSSLDAPSELNPPQRIPSPLCLHY